MERELYNWLEREFYKSNQLNIIDILKNGLLIYVPIKLRALEIK